MKVDFIFILLGCLPRLALGLLLFAWPAAAQDATPEELRQKLEALQAEVARLRLLAEDAQRLQELERRIDLLAEEIEKTRTGGASDGEPPAQGEPGLGPAASKVYHKARGVSIGGYGEALYENFAAAAQDGSPSGRRDRLDLLRFVLYTGYKFSDSILFNSETEFEHATTGEGDEARGEVSVELAYLEFKPWKRVGIRAGMLLLPVGFVNELHEPPTFFGARRPDLEQAIVPTTWHEVGVGLFGETGPFQWRGYLVSGLNSAGFSAEGIAEGRQQGSQSLAESLALSGRLDYVGTPGLLLGASLYTGNSGQEALVLGRSLAGRVTLFDLHAQYEGRGLRVRALYARTRVADAALINAQNRLSGAASVGSLQRGFYVEAGYDLLNPHPKGQWAVVPYLRFEKLDTQAEVPAGFLRDPALERRVLSAGVSVKPVTNIALKADYQWYTNRARTGVGQLNLGIGFLF